MEAFPDNMMEKWAWEVPLMKYDNDDPSSDENTGPMFPKATRADSQPMAYQVSSAATGCDVGSSSDWLGSAASGHGATKAAAGCVAGSSSDWLSEKTKSTQTDSSHDCGPGNPSTWLWLQGYDAFHTNMEVSCVVITWVSGKAVVKAYTKGYEEPFG
jgi:hypothetical protein